MAADTHAEDTASLGWKDVRRRCTDRGFGERPGETGREQSQNRAPGPLDRAALSSSESALVMATRLLADAVD
jgi:hypothetical protein